MNVSGKVTEEEKAALTQKEYSPVASYPPTLFDDFLLTRKVKLPEEENRSSLSESWKELAVDPDEAKAEQSCHVNPYMRGKFPHRIVNVVDGTRLGYFKADEGLDAILYVHHSCAIEVITISRITGPPRVVQITSSPILWA